MVKAKVKTAPGGFANGLLSHLMKKAGPMPTGLIKPPKLVNNDGSMSQIGKSKNKLTIQQKGTPRIARIKHTPSTAYTGKKAKKASSSNSPGPNLNG